MQEKEYSLIVVGSGISGLYAALRADEKLKLYKKVLIITKSELRQSNSIHAQGGIASVLPENEEDSVELHVKDTLKAGAGLSDEKVAEAISERGAKIIDDLIKKGVMLDRDKDQKVALTLEAAHSVRRILHAGGDATGRYIGQALANRVLEHKNIEVKPFTQAVELLLDTKGSCHGIIAFDEKKNEHIAYFAGAIVIATGGIGQLYLNTTNPKVATADGMAIAYRAGAMLQDLEFLQFHPTAFKPPMDDDCFLISEAVRGEGAKLVNINGEHFAKNYHEKAELAPRDIVARANFFEIEKTRAKNVFLDATKLNPTHILKRFPSVNEKCLENGDDMTKDILTVAPAAHYYMGGIKVSTQGQSSVKNLFATGEVSCTSLHGANRLASNSLLECVVLSDELARNLHLKEDFCENDENILKTIKKYDNKKISKPNLEKEEKIRKELKLLMWNNVGIIRNEKKLQEALKKVQEFSKEFPEEIFNSLQEYELKNMLLMSELIIKSAIARKESRGSHYREDYLELLKEAKHSYTNIKRKNRKDEIFFE